MNSPLISVIVPVYNSERTLRQCVDSILGQHSKRFELLLIDDGSQDGSVAICDEYSAKDIRVKTFHKTNGGVSSARNLAIDNARGKWICFIDSDDYVTDAFFDGVSESNDDLLIKGYMTFDEHGNVECKDSQYFSKANTISSFWEEYFDDTITRGPISKFYKKDLLEDLRFLEDMKIGEDAYFVFKYLAKCKTFKLLGEGFYMIRNNDNPYEVRYSMDVETAANSLNHLYDAFSFLRSAHNINPSLFMSYLAFFKLLSKEDWYQRAKRWYYNPIVKSLYQQIWPSLSYGQRAYLILSKYYNLCFHS